MSDKKLALSNSEIEVRTKDDIRKLIQYYQDFFSDIQVKFLIYIWYGYPINYAKEKTGISDELLQKWMSDPRFVNAINVGQRHKEKFLQVGIENAALVASHFLQEFMLADIPFDDLKALRLKLEAAQFLLKHKNSLTGGSSEDNSKFYLPITEETAKIVAEHINKSDEEIVSIKQIIEENDEVVDAEFKDLADYYNFVATDNAFVDEGYINVLKVDDETFKFQCHICGKFYQSLDVHISKKHSQIGIKAYRHIYGIPKNLPLSVNENFLEIISSRLDELEGM